MNFLVILLIKFIIEPYAQDKISNVLSLNVVQKFKNCFLIFPKIAFWDQFQTNEYNMNIQIKNVYLREV